VTVPPGETCTDSLSNSSLIDITSPLVGLVTVGDFLFDCADFENEELF
jgi:hypothetical protein